MPRISLRKLVRTSSAAVAGAVARRSSGVTGNRDDSRTSWIRLAMRRESGHSSCGRIGRAILSRCEEEALASGFTSAVLVATLAGHELYRRLGYAGDEPIEHQLNGGVTIQFISMRKELHA